MLIFISQERDPLGVAVQAVCELAMLMTAVAVNLAAIGGASTPPPAAGQADAPPAPSTNPDQAIPDRIAENFANGETR
jgi:hypothetical protein